MKTRKGWLIRRGKTFHAAWKVSGKLFTKTTGTGDRREATKRLGEIMRPFLVEDEARTLESVKARIEGARAELAKIEEDRNPPLTVADAWDAYEKAPTATGKNRPEGHRPDSSDATLAQYDFQFKAFAEWAATKPEIKTLADVTPAFAREYAAHLARTVGEATFNKHIGLLQLVWKTLAKPGRIAANPWEQVGRKRAVVQSRRELTADELRRVCGTAEGELRTLLAVGLYTGLRLGDAATLRWEETDLARREIRRVPSKTARRNPNPVIVPMHPTLAAMLAETPQNERKGYVLPDTAAAYTRRRDAVTDLVQRHFDACDVQTTKLGTGADTGKRAVIEAGYHSLRHTFVSLCREADVPLSVVESIVGHSSPVMTRHYTHTGAKAAAAAVSALPSVMGDEPKALPPVRTVSAEAVRKIAEGMNSKTWKAARAELLALAGKE
jgi:integrase